jgi:selenocysteine-specific elongation factor
VTLTPLQQREVHDIVRRLEQSPFSPPTLTVDRELLMYLVMTDQVVEVADGVVFAARAWRELLTWVLTTIDTQGNVSVANLRDRFDTSRKYALAVMEYLDAQKITRRHDDVRVRYTPQ